MPESETERNARLGVRARTWAHASSRKRSAPSRDAVEFRVASYNTLACGYASELRRSLYRVATHRLEWSSRSKTLAAELKILATDVLCVQEYEEETWRTMRRTLDGLSYSRGAFAERASAEKRDGCAIFYRSDVFECEYSENVSFANHGLGDNAACVVTLRHRKRKDIRIVIANGHLIFNPKRGDVKVGQARMLLATAAKMRQRSIDRGFDTHCLVCGDFNISPTGPLYDFFRDGHLDLSAVRRRELSGTLLDYDKDEDEHSRECERDDIDIASETEEVAMRAFRNGWDAQGIALALGDRQTPFPCRTNVPLTITDRASNVKEVDEIREMMRWTSGGCVIHHALAGELKSSYVTVDGREPTFTTCHAKFTGTNDFIWHTDKLEPIRVLRCPNIDEVVRHGRLPSVRYASDHICLVTDFRI